MTYFIIILIAFFFATQLIIETLKSSFYEQRKYTLSQQAQVVSSEALSYLKKENKKILPFEQRLNQITEKMLNTRILIIEMSVVPKYIVDTNQNEKENKIGKLPPDELVGRILQAKNYDTTSKTKDDSNMHIAVPVYDNVEKGRIIGAVHLVASISDIDSSIKTIQQKLYILNLIVGIIVGILSYFFSNMITRPIVQMIEVIEKMAHGQLHQRININGSDEIAELGKAFNVMSDQLEQIDSSRQEFVSNASHELRTPLSSMKVLIQSLLIQEGQPEEIYREFLKDINSEIDRLTNIINDLLDMVKLDKMAPLNLQELSLTELIQNIVKRTQPLADQKNIEIIFDNKKNIVGTFDEIKASQAISNLIDNAIKYSNEWGIVEITLSQDNYHNIVEVKDHGIGIPQEDLNKIFERFYRVDKMRSRDSGGTGLGLSIAQKAVLIHGGKITVESEVNDGTTFTLYFPRN